MTQEEFKQDLDILEAEISNTSTQLTAVNNQRASLVARLQQLNGVAAYLRGKLNMEKPEVEEEKPKDETPEEKSEA